MGSNRVLNKGLKEIQSTLKRSEGGRPVLTVSYRGKGWDAAIHRALRQHGFSDEERRDGDRPARGNLKVKFGATLFPPLIPLGKSVAPAEKEGRYGGMYQ